MELFLAVGSPVVVAIVSWWAIHAASRRERAADRERELVEAGAELANVLAAAAQRGQQVRARWPKMEMSRLSWAMGGEDKMVAAMGGLDESLGRAVAARFRILSLTASADVHEATDAMLESLNEIMALTTRAEPPTGEEWKTVLAVALGTHTERLRTSIQANMKDLRRSLRKALPKGTRVSIQMHGPKAIGPGAVGKHGR